jgi:1-acyl-sn-glycerol-3-phosphate acyltransferase
VRSHVNHRGSPEGARAHEGIFAKKLRELTRHHLAGKLAEAIDFGLVRQTCAYIAPLYRYYFRAEVVGLERVPDEPTLLVGNHDGGYIPVDGICLGYAWHTRFDYTRPLAVLMHDFPFRISATLTEYLSRCGCRPASRKQLDRAFANKESLLVYPGGASEAFRPYVKRRRINLGHRTGFIAAALQHKVPIAPVVSVGAHETLFVISSGRWLARHLPLAKKMRSDVVPLWLGLPWGVGWGPLPHIPLPSKIKVEVLQPIRLWNELGPDASADDPATLRRGLDLVRGRMQEAADRLYTERHWPILG